MVKTVESAVSNVTETVGDTVSNTTTGLFAGLQKYRVLAIVGVFVSFFVIVGVLNYFQRLTLENFVNNMQRIERFGGCTKKNQNTEEFTSCNKKNNQ
jgi:hypothetical protein